MELKLGTHQYVASIVKSTLEGPPLYFVHCPALYSRGRMYTSDQDEHRRFLALSYAALQLCGHLDFTPDVVHCHDWQAALIPMLLKTFGQQDRRLRNAKSLLTIHNLNYQGSFHAMTGPDTNLDNFTHLFHQDLLKQDRINYMLQGVLYADGISTVSPTYAKEIQTEAHGAGLDGMLRQRTSTVVGILNGVDYHEWSPETDKHIKQHFSAQDLSGKATCKEALLQQLGLPYHPGIPVVGIVSRLVWQKGFDLVGEVMPQLLSKFGFQLVVLGSGEPPIEELFRQLQRAFPRQVCFFNGFQNPLAHMIEAGADMFVMPSRYEPCGLNQMYSLRYGTVPIVHKTGGLADTVEQWNPRSGRGTGFPFEHHDAAGLRWGLEAAFSAFKDRRQWDRLVQNGMAQDYGWGKQSKLYELVYQRLLTN
jgi:starch synthase